MRHSIGQGSDAKVGQGQSQWLPAAHQNVFRLQVPVRHGVPVQFHQRLVEFHQHFPRLLLVERSQGQQIPQRSVFGVFQ